MTVAVSRAVLVVIWLTAVFLLDRCVRQPYQCNVAMKTVRPSTAQSYRAEAVLVAARFARRNLDLLKVCEKCCPRNVGASMLIAANYRSLGSPREAVKVYQRALKADQRPELLLNLGQAQIEAGDFRNGIANLTSACIYNPVYLEMNLVPFPEVRHAVELYQLKLIAIRNQKERNSS